MTARGTAGDVRRADGERSELGSERPLAPATRAFAEPGFGFEFSRVRIAPGSGEHPIQRKCSTCEAKEEQLQAKLSVSQPDDPLEQEADRFAEQVMRGHAPAVSHGAAPAVQRDALEEAVAEAERVQDDEPDAVPAGARTGRLFAKRAGQTPAAVPAHSIPQRDGQPLEPAVRRFMRERTGFDFAGVRIHADAEAAASASRLAARAYTVGSDIYFGRGQYHPASHEGRTLLAHELAHVVQQSRGRLQPRPDGPAMELAAPGPASVSAAPPSIQRRLLPPGNCIQGIHDQMQRAVKAWCDHPSGRTCSPGESCGRLLQKIRRNQMCARNRRIINNVCYEGGDEGHRIAERDARRAQANCMAIFRVSCMPRPVPQPERAPERAPERTSPQVDRSFLDRMAAITGLTGTALIVYLIVSEGSRLFPPRNLIPVP